MAELKPDENPTWDSNPAKTLLGTWIHLNNLISAKNKKSREKIIKFVSPWLAQLIMAFT